MKKLARSFGILMALVGLVEFANAKPASLEEKPSLKVWGQKLKSPEQITALYKETMTSLKVTPASKKIVKQNAKVLAEIEQAFSESRSFVRGEIENEVTLNHLVVGLQLMGLAVRDLAVQNKWDEVEKHFSNWFLFAADFPYEEATIFALRANGVVRSLLLDDLERIQKKYAKEIAKSSTFRTWFLGVRAPWPVDRVILFEAQRSLPKDLSRVAEKVAKAYQKNPYEPSEKAVREAKAQDIKESELLKSIWKKSDIDLMVAEMNRIGWVKIDLAAAEFEFKNKRRPKSVQELVSQKLLDRAPVDYLTGRGLELPAN